MIQDSVNANRFISFIEENKNVLIEHLKNPEVNFNKTQLIRSEINTLEKVLALATGQCDTLKL